jgi:transcriptional regulator GlxA family with amidase domain
MSLLHCAPGRHWTVFALAREAAVSRSVLDARFREVLGRSPIRYVTQWRMHLAQDLLATTDLGVGAIARRVGYDAEEAYRMPRRSHVALTEHNQDRAWPPETPDGSGRGLGHRPGRARRALLAAVDCQPRCQ